MLCGLWASALTPKVQEAYEDSDTELWVMNDFFNLIYPREKITRIYNLHYGIEASYASREMWGNWKWHYNDCENAHMYKWHDEIVTGIDRVKNFDIDRALSFWPEGAYQSSFSYMLADAVLDGFCHVAISRCRLAAEEEHEAQCRPLLWCLRECEKLGVSVDAEWRYEWEGRYTEEEKNSIQFNPAYCMKKRYGVKPIDPKALWSSKGGVVV